MDDAKIVGVVTHVQAPVMRVEMISNVVGEIPAYFLREPGKFQGACDSREQFSAQGMEMAHG